MFPLKRPCCLDDATDNILRDSTCFLNATIENVIQPHPGTFEKKFSAGDPWVWAKALLLVLFSFEGWENATFVSARLHGGDSRRAFDTDVEATWQVAIPRREENRNFLRRVLMTAVIVVGVLYLCAVAVFVCNFCFSSPRAQADLSTRSKHFRMTSIWRPLSPSTMHLTYAGQTLHPYSPLQRSSLAPHVEVPFISP